MKLLWNETNVAEATRGEVRGHFHASRVEIDSRKIQLGDLFVAIKGERVDGHHYVADALARGAVAAVVSRMPEDISPKSSLVVVNDTMQALVDLGTFARARSRAKIVGVTGSVGKTSTKDMLKLALAAHGKTYATSGNYNNHIGVPLNLANLPEDAAFGVFEMGMNHAGEILHLTRMVRPHVAVITAVEAVHLEFFESVQGIADAKAEIFAGVESSGAAVLNADNPYYEYLLNKAKTLGITRCYSFGEAAGSDARLVTYQPSVNGMAIAANIDGAEYHCTMAASGKHLARNALSALQVVVALGLPVAPSIAALASFSESEGRGRAVALPVAGGTAWLIDDSYNASPASVRAALARVAEWWEARGKKGRKIAALGDMLELGNDAPALHAALSDDVIQHGFNQLFTAGALMKHLSAALPKEYRAAHVAEAKQLAPLLQKTLQPDDVLLLKGSHGSKMHELVTMLVSSSSSSSSSPAEKKHAV